LQGAFEVFDGFGVLFDDLVFDGALEEQFGGSAFFGDALGEFFDIVLGAFVGEGGEMSYTESTEEHCTESAEGGTTPHVVAYRGKFGWFRAHN
jgi:hypothetical protein